MKKKILSLAFFLFTAGILYGAEPSWLHKTIIPQKEYIYAVGHSQPKENEQLAKDEAFADALKIFAKYCKSDVDSVDLSRETYSSEKKKGSSSLEATSQNTVRAKAVVSGAIAEEWHIQKEHGNYAVSVLVKIPKSEFDRISHERNPAVSLDVLFYYENEEGRMQALTDGCIMKSGDAYALYVKPSGTCYLYVFQIDGLGKAFRLFPNEAWKTGVNPIPAGSDCWIPNSNNLFVLDDVTGKESFYLFASPEKIQEFENASGATMTKSSIDSVAKLKKMGVACIKEKQDKTQVVPPKHRQMDVVDVKKRLQADGAFIYETWYWHR